MAILDPSQAKSLVELASVETPLAENNAHNEGNSKTEASATSLMNATVADRMLNESYLKDTQKLIKQVRQTGRREGES